MQRFLHQIKQTRGFTLLELLVVISIIAILIAVGAAAFTTAQQQGRDSRRIGDMQAIQKSFEQYYAQNFQYSPTCTSMYAALNNVVPRDPVNTSPYTYTITCSSTSTYCACARLNSTTKGNSTDATCSFNAAGGSYFCVTNLQ